MSLPRILLTLLLPPLSVYVRCGARRPFWVNCVLTLLWYVPGVVHAFWLLRRGAARDRAAGTGRAAPAQKERGRPTARPSRY